MASKTLPTDRDEAQRALDVLTARGQVVELRALEVPRGGRKVTVAGYFNVWDALLKALPQAAPAKGVYITLNPVNPALLARAANRLREVGKGESTPDHEIIARRWLAIDCDPVRPSGISSTDEEHAHALARAREIRGTLAVEGWPEPIEADSGNGGHLLYRIDLPNDPAASALLQRALDALAFRWNDRQVTLDQTVYNASRIWRLYGTVNRKGDHTLDRPHRIARILRVPDALSPVPLALLEALTDCAPPEPAKAPTIRPEASRPFDLEAWLAGYGLDVTGPDPWQNGRRWVFALCPWNAEHTNRAAYIVQHANGAIAAGCHHNSCHGKGWHDLRDRVEPGWRERRTTEGGNGAADCENPWIKAKPVSALLAAHEPEAQWLVPKLLAPGSITAFMAPRGLGKTHVAHALAVAVALGGAFCGIPVTPGRVLLIDRDNSPREITRRLRAWGADGADHLHVLRRDEAPDLKDATAWACFPVADYDVVIIDSIGASTEGIDDKDAGRTGKALAHILDLARQGPGILLLGNATKAADHYRGSGTWADRVDILYEVRDATDLSPSGKGQWWMDLAPGGEAAWAQRAERRKKRETYRLAFVPSKFRIGEEPDPFCVELHMPAGAPWTLRDVTGELEQAGVDAHEHAALTRQATLTKAADALERLVVAQAKAGATVTKTEAEATVKLYGIPRKEARDLITAGHGTRWRLVPMGDKKGSPLELRPCDTQLHGGNTVALEPLPDKGCETPIYAAGSGMGGVNTQACNPGAPRDADGHIYAVAPGKDGGNQRPGSPVPQELLDTGISAVDYTDTEPTPVEEGRL